MPPKAPFYRLAMAATAPEMGDIAKALRPQFPAIADAIEKQQREIENSGVDVFARYRHTPEEPIAGLSPCPIDTMSGMPDA